MDPELTGYWPPKLFLLEARSISRNHRQGSKLKLFVIVSQTYVFNAIFKEVPENVKFYYLFHIFVLIEGHLIFFIYFSYFLKQKSSSFQIK